MFIQPHHHNCNHKGDAHECPKCISAVGLFGVVNHYSLPNDPNDAAEHADNREHENPNISQKTEVFRHVSLSSRGRTGASRLMPSRFSRCSRALAQIRKPNQFDRETALSRQVSYFGHMCVNRLIAAGKVFLRKELLRKIRHILELRWEGAVIK